VLLAVGRPEEALECFDRSLQLQPHLVDAALGRAEVLQRIGRPEQATAALEDALRHADFLLALTPQDYLLHLARGDALRRLLRLEEAIESLGCGLSIKATHTGLLRARAELLTLLGQAAGARTDLETLCANDPKAEDWAALAELLAASGEHQAALGILNSALKANEGGQLGRLFIALGRVHHARGDLPLAIVNYTRATELAPDDGPTLRALGLAQLEAGEVTPALEALAAATVADPYDAIGWIALGQAHQRAQQRREASACFERAVALDDGHEGAWVGLAQLALAERQSQRAATCAYAALELDESCEPARGILSTLGQPLPPQAPLVAAQELDVTVPSASPTATPLASDASPATPQSAAPPVHR